MADWQRSHTCGELRAEQIGQTVTLNGWVNTVRRHHQQLFVDLRDRYGVTQVVVDADDPATHAVAEAVGREFVVSVTGPVAARLPGKENKNLATGAIEVKAATVRVLNPAPRERPFEVTEFPDEELANEDLRLEYRYLDLRRPTLQRTLILRHQINKTIRDFLDAQGFLEIETPLLGRSTPEGARDYLVPSRVHPGHWYALPQSPQLYKQLLMVAGYDKYFQIAHCLRDEDLRADRQPEFTQLDLEMSFVEPDNVLNLIEKLMAAVFRRCRDVEIALPLPRLSYEEAMRRFGSDKPDLRYGMEIVEVSDLAGQSESTIFKNALAGGGAVRGLNAKAAAERFSRKGLDELTTFVQQYRAKGLAWLKVEAAKFTGPLEKSLPGPVQQALRERLGAKPGDLLLFVADMPGVVGDALGALRCHLANVLKLIDPAKAEFRLAWIVDFPMFIFDAEEGRWAANHHPFTAPRDEDLPDLETDPGRVKAKAYDLVINGYEAGGGSIRIHSEAVQQRVFQILGMGPEQSRERFGFLLDALRYGAPPHGGIALGLDRLAMILGGTTNIRDVIAFPKNQRARDLMTGAPAPVEQRQLRDLGF